MSSNVKLNTLLLKHHQHCQQRLVKALLITFAGLLLALVLYYFRERSIVLGGFALNFRHFSLVLLLPLAVLAAIEWRCYIRLKVTFREYTQVLVNLELAMLATKHEVARKKLLNAQANAKNNHLALAAIAERAPFIDSHIELLTKAALSEKLKVEMAAFRQECDAKLQTMKSQVPLIKAENKLRSLLAYIQARREQVTKQWEEAYDNSSWWNKLVNAGPVPGVSELDKAERDLKQMHSTLMIRHGKDLKRLETHFAKLKANTLLRVSAAKSAAMRFITGHGRQQDLDADLLKKALWFSTLSLPISAWADMSEAGNVYDALRQVNSNFSGMSDTEIWWESLFMPAESLVGLAALTKGAYFEQLVAADTGGTLFEHFNHPDTDIVIGGVAYQLKATDSAAYVNSVDPDILVISTSEVAFSTDSIDSGFSNEDLSNTVDLALGGTVIDLGDSAADAILAGVGGLGFFATIAGINHAADRHAKGDTLDEAIVGGAEVAVIGTARSLVGAAEMTFNVLASRPSRFIGRFLLKGLKKL